MNVVWYFVIMLSLANHLEAETIGPIQNVEGISGEVICERLKEALNANLQETLDEDDFIITSQCFAMKFPTVQHQEPKMGKD
jgi:hypothetical protein